MKKLIFTTSTLLFASFLNAQQFLSAEREREIKKTGNYYWAEGEHPKQEDIARSLAFNSLSEEILQYAVYQSIKNKEDLKELEMSVHFDRIQQEGMICVLAWISKDSVFVTTRRPVQTAQNPTITRPVEPTKDEIVTDPVMQKLVKCKTYKEINKILQQNGCIIGALNSSKGFDNVEQCIIAVFSNDGRLQALLDKGAECRTDLISGEIIKTPETYYINKGYNLLYVQK